MSRDRLLDGSLGWSAMLSGVACATPACAQRLGQGGGVEIAWWRVGGALILCLLLACVGAFALRFRMRAAGQTPNFRAVRGQAWAAFASALRPSAAPLQRQPKRLKLIETVRLSHQVDVCLLECDEHMLLVAATPQGVFVLNSSEVPTGPASR